MSEEEWLRCADPERMLLFLNERATNRKLRLFAVACCRRVYMYLEDPRSREAVEIAEDYCDGKASEASLREAESESVDAWDGEVENQIWAVAAAIHVAGADARVAAVWTARCAAAFHGDREWRDLVDAMDLPVPAQESWEVIAAPRGDALAERKEQASLVRELFCHPKRSISVAPNPTIVRLAEAIYLDHAFDRMPILADALEEAGCCDEALLAHCREPGEHVRGCWVLDLLLAKK